MTEQKKRVPAPTGTLADELRILHETTGKLLECYTLYATAYYSLSELHRKELEHTIMFLYQEVKDMELAPSLLQHLSLVKQKLQKTIIWLYVSADTIEHSTVYMPEEYLVRLLADMRTEPYIPAVRPPQNKKRGRREQ